MTTYPMHPRAFYAQGGPRRSYVAASRMKPGEHALPVPPNAPTAQACPPAILDSSPDGTGLGIWLLVEEGDGTCTYEYGGGIA